jgi:hypothetical protein
VTEAPAQARGGAPGSIAAAIGAGLLAPAALVVLLAAAGFALGLPIGPAHAVFGIAVGGLLAAYAGRAAGIASRLALVGIGVSPLLGWAAACAIAGRILDLSWDGLVYHGPAVTDLARGWNPFRSVAEPFRTGQTAFWIEHYPKASWEVAAALHRLGLPFQATKGANLVLAGAAFCYAFAAARARAGLSAYAALAVAAAAALNPVVIAQALSMCLDGQLAATLTILVSALLVVQLPALRAAASVGVAGAVLYLPNLKFTGTVYAVGAVLAFVAIGLLRRGPNTLRSGAAFAVALAVAIAFVGYGPYVTNTRMHGHPFFPIMGPGKVDIMTVNTPPSLLGRDRLTALALATLSASDGWEVRPKLPFQVTRGELRQLGVVDLRIGGFGPLFGGAILLALATGLLLWWKAPSSRRDPAWLVVAALVASVLVNPEAWWARYVPQLWLVPIAVAVIALRAGRRWLGGAAVAVALAGAALAIDSHGRAAEYWNGVAETHLAALARLPQPLEVYFGPFEGLEPTLRERGIAFRKQGSAPSCDTSLPPLGFPEYAVCPAGAPSAATR